MTKRLLAAPLALTLLAACVPQVEVPPPAPAPSPAPAPVPTPAPTPSFTPPPQPVYEHWMDAPQTPGDWFYKSIPPFSYAGFGESDTVFEFVMRCDNNTATVSVGRVSSQQVAQPMMIRTETMERLLTARPRQGSIETLLAIDLPAHDPIFDAMALSKGRFAVEVGGEPTLYIPSWPELTRLVEDCR